MPENPGSSIKVLWLRSEERTTRSCAVCNSVNWSVGLGLMNVPPMILFRFSISNIFDDSLY